MRLKQLYAVFKFRKLRGIKQTLFEFDAVCSLTILTQVIRFRDMGV
jgi:hypothetical protein